MNENYGGAIYIDDTGTPGQTSKSKFLDPERKSWAAVIVPATVETHINEFMMKLNKAMMLNHGVDEFHATDIFMGRGLWKEVSFEKRIGLLETMVMMLKGFGLPIIFQTSNPNVKKDFENRGINNDFDVAISKGKIDQFWNIREISHQALLILCTQINKHFLELSNLDQEAFPKAFPTFIDEGLAKSGNIIELPFDLKRSIKDNRISFVGSKEKYGIQIADFVAFFVGRCQWIMAKTEKQGSLSRADKALVRLNGNDGLNILNLPMINYKEDSISRESYEFILRRFS